MNAGYPGGFPYRPGFLPVHEGTGGNEDDNKEEEPQPLGCP